MCYSCAYEYSDEHIACRSDCTHLSVLLYWVLFVVVKFKQISSLTVYSFLLIIRFVFLMSKLNILTLSSVCSQDQQSVCQFYC